MARLLLLVLAFSFAGPAPSPGPRALPASPSVTAEARTPGVLVLRLEGVRVDAMAEAWTPALDALRAGGMWTDRVRSGAGFGATSWSDAAHGRSVRGIPVAVGTDEAIEALGPDGAAARRRPDPCGVRRVRRRRRRGVGGRGSRGRAPPRRGPGAPHLRRRGLAGAGHQRRARRRRTRDLDRLGALGARRHADARPLAGRRRAAGGVTPGRRGAGRRHVRARPRPSPEPPSPLGGPLGGGARQAPAAGDVLPLREPRAGAGPGPHRVGPRRRSRRDGGRSGGRRLPTGARRTSTARTSTTPGGTASRCPPTGSCRDTACPIYLNSDYPFEKNPPFIRHDDDPVGHYRTWFTVPEAWAGDRVVLHFGAVHSAVYVWVNGVQGRLLAGEQAAGRVRRDPLRARGPATSWPCEVYRWSDGSYLEDQDFWRLSGIERDVYLYAEPHTRLADVWVRAGLDDAYRDGVLDLDVTVARDAEGGEPGGAARRAPGAVGRPGPRRARGAARGLAPGGTAHAHLPTHDPGRAPVDGRDARALHAGPDAGGRRRRHGRVGAAAGGLPHRGDRGRPGARERRPDHHRGGGPARARSRRPATW